MANDDSTFPFKVKRRNLAGTSARLERLYPGVRCEAHWSEFPVDGTQFGGRAVWSVSFFASEMTTLIRHGLATAELFEMHEAAMRNSILCRHPCFRDELGGSIDVTAWPNGAYQVRRLFSDYATHEKPFTKKLQADVARYLKPFIRGTWKPRQRGEASHG